MERGDTGIPTAHAVKELRRRPAPDDAPRGAIRGCTDAHVGHPIEDTPPARSPAGAAPASDVIREEMDCAHTRDLIARFVAGELENPLRTRVWDHIRHCREGCYILYRAARVGRRIAVAIMGN